ncbi:MAG: nucleotidyltransferase, partial [Afipia sp.]|nr:nucleotidyltransferase [Afipia sp.]
HIHNLVFLRTQAERIDDRLIEAWPREVKADRSRFEKLKEAYIKARYSPLCRTRHKGDYAERATMPSGRLKAPLSRNFAVIGSA